MCEKLPKRRISAAISGDLEGGPLSEISIFIAGLYPVGTYNDPHPTEQLLKLES